MPPLRRRHVPPRQPPSTQNIQRSVYFGRMLPMALILIVAAVDLYRLNQHLFIATDNNYDTNLIIQVRDKNDKVPMVKREWGQLGRMLYGIFTYDSPNEANLRAANRETHLSYFKHRYNISEGTRPDMICSLNELLGNSTLARDTQSCRIVYSFVMGGGIGNVNMTRKAGLLKREMPKKKKRTQREKLDEIREKWDEIKTKCSWEDPDCFEMEKEKWDDEIKTRCLWEDPECGGNDISRWTLHSPKCNISNILARELSEHSDVTFLSIAENHELGKTDTWFTFMAMLTWQYPELQIGFVAKMDSDNFIRWPIFLNYFEKYVKTYIDKKPYIYGGYTIHKKVCSGPGYGYVCRKENFIAELFASGAHAYMSTKLAQHVFMYGTTLERKKDVWFVGEDMQLANMAYSDPNVKPHVINHRYGQYGNLINLHCFNDPALYRREYYKSYPDQPKSYEWD